METSPSPKKTQLPRSTLSNYNDAGDEFIFKKKNGKPTVLKYYWNAEEKAYLDHLTKPFSSEKEGSDY